MFQAMRRPQKAISEADAWNLLKQASYGVLCVHGTQGYPYAMPMNHVVIDDSLIFHAAVVGHRLEALRADQRACFTVTVGPEEEPGAILPNTLGTYASVVVFGKIAVLPAERQEEALEALVQRYLPQRAGEAEKYLREGGEVSVLRMSVEHISGKRLLVE
jgi:nitroimidazol reductase NimA-like FMN-containing flavoprotein (pyridoxamine 5'-phosphate oxidase superfamily)